MTVEGRTHKPVISHAACNTCSVCFRACPAEVMVGLRNDEESLCGIVYGANQGESSIASRLSYSLPPCQEACPLNQDIRGYIKLIAEGRFKDAMEVVCATNPMPLICGYVCHRPCESACVKQQMQQSVPIRALKLFIADNYDFTPIPAAEPGSRETKISIIGTGPAGLATAHELVRSGFTVEMFESHTEPGGMLSWAIPDFRLPRKALDKEFKRLVEMGVTIHTSVRFGDDFDYLSLVEKGSNAVVIATGAVSSIGMSIFDDRNLPGITDCLSFLRDLAQQKPVNIGKNVLVIGGGNAAIDTARIAVKLGVETVKILYRRSIAEMPADRFEVEEAMREGVTIEFQTQPLELMTSKETVIGLKCVKTILVEDPKSNRLKPMEKAGTEFEIEGDFIISAIGQSPDFEQILKGLPVKPDWKSKNDLSDRKTIKKIPGLFTTGDFSNGASTVVEALASGLRTAASVIDYLGERK